MHDLIELACMYLLSQRYCFLHARDLRNGDTLPVKVAALHARCLAAVRWAAITMAAVMAVAFAPAQAKPRTSRPLPADIARQCETIGALASTGPATFARHDLFGGEDRVIKVDLLNDGAPVDVRLGSEGTAHVPELETPNGNSLSGPDQLLEGDGVLFGMSLSLLRIDSRIWTVASVVDDSTNTVWLAAATDNNAVCDFAPRIVSSRAVLTSGLSPADATLARDILLHGGKEAQTADPPIDQDKWNAIAPNFPLIGPGFLTGKAWHVHLGGTMQLQTLSQVGLDWGGGPGCDDDLVVWTDKGAVKAYWPIWPLYSGDNPQIGLGKSLSWRTLCSSTTEPISVAPNRTLLLLTRERAKSTREGAVLIDITNGISKHGRILGHVENVVVNPLTNPR